MPGLGAATSLANSVVLGFEPRGEVRPREMGTPKDVALVVVPEDDRRFAKLGGDGGVEAEEVAVVAGERK
jgi:hypothetical protein